MMKLKVFSRCLIATIVLSQTACASAQTASAYMQGNGATQQLSPLQQVRQPTKANLSIREEFMQIFCSKHALPYGSAECRKVFLQEWAKSSVESGKELSREGFEQLDEWMKKGSHKVGEKWGEYYREFKLGARKGRLNN